MYTGPDGGVDGVEVLVVGQEKQVLQVRPEVIALLNQEVGEQPDSLCPGRPRASLVEPENGEWMNH